MADHKDKVEGYEPIAVEQMPVGLKFQILVELLVGRGIIAAGEIDQALEQHLEHQRKESPHAARDAALRARRDR